MTPINRISLILFITWCLIAQLYLLAFPVAIYYLLKQHGYELVFVAILVDGYYQAFYSIPYLSIFTVSLIFILEMTKSHLLMYTDKNEIIP